jgi:GNAT superfamily N-acetyltransferase
MYVTKELALQMELCIKQTHVAMAASYSFGKVLEVAEGAACFAGGSSFFSQVISWGFTLKARQFHQQIQTIEQFYHSLGHSRVDIELCPLVGNSLAMALSQRGYAVTELSTIHYMPLCNYSQTPLSCSYEVRQVPIKELDIWANRVALGFGYLEAQEQFAQYARLKGVTAFAVYDKEQIVAGAAVAVHGDVADLGVTSTLPAYREQGIQKLLVHTRLNFVKNQSIPLAIVTTEPGSISDLNIQKVGFHCAYTRVKFTKSNRLRYQ